MKPESRPMPRPVPPKGGKHRPVPPDSTLTLEQLRELNQQPTPKEKP